MTDTEPVAEFWSFPTNPAEFDADDRISFSKLDNKYIAVQEDGAEYEWDGGLKRSLPLPRQNTAVYVTGLPTDATLDEVAELFSRKCGVIAEEIDGNRPRIKMYTDADGSFKGDALIVFFKPQSVDMAIMLLDDTDFRFTGSSSSGPRMRVQPADSSYKKTSYDTQQQRDEKQDGGGDGPNGAATAGGKDGGASRQQRSSSDKQKIIKKTQKLDAKLADWDDDDPYPHLAAALPPADEGRGPASRKAERTVILKHMFTLQELEDDPAALLDIKEDIRDECEKLGDVTNIVLFDLEPEGIVSVKFRQQPAAEACIKLMHGRSFDGRTVEASFSTGKEKFRKSKDRGDDVDGDGE
ncbi:splicing factor U2AF-associated protein 2 [Magnaporthiopsis poae ATCC 64411]|uniref:Splicing factor U2AF-associated protein 2 n=1 Tax=Magnaporthiopsis poae (strain ATCC 64411 / 73-15) TaxID=644358 RepID=A0A0C4DTI2_MAGP6|nr:splicing factor U2AF-associated protein 2 [Magnaporthiopsis poae ATCC 64411]